MNGVQLQRFYLSRGQIFGIFPSSGSLRVFKLHSTFSILLVPQYLVQD